jgi:hypothetical protein
MYPSHKEQKEYADYWEQYLTQFPFEWHATLTFNEDVKYFTAIGHFKYWRKTIETEKKFRLGGFCFTVYRGDHPHIHVLVLGRGQNGSTLYDMSKRYGEMVWCKNPKNMTTCRGYARVKEIASGDVENVAGYVARHFNGFMARYCRHDPFGEDLLMEHFEPRHAGVDFFGAL